MRTNLLEALSDNIKVDPAKCTACGVCVDRCILDNLRLKLAPCRQGCPLGVNCQGYVQLTLRGQEAEALAMVERELPFPGILGRLCSAQCEATCHRGQVGDAPVAIRALKRYLVDVASGQVPAPEKAAPTGKRAAVVGAGPAGMLAAFDLLRQGHAVTMFDAESEPGGMLRWAIPAFRLPAEALAAEWARLEALGVEFSGGRRLGADLSLDDLAKDYDAVIVAVGCPQPRKLDLPHEDAEGVASALELLRAVRAGEKPQVGKRVVVIGGGDVALDAAQTALRLGAASVLVACLEERDTMPASPEALALAEAEGVELEGSWGPLALQAEGGAVTGVELQRCLAVLDAFGRFAPRFDECVTKTVPADTVIVAIGQERDASLAPTGCDELTGQDAGQEKVFWAGDAVGGPSTIVEAMASGRKAAESAHRLMTGQHLTYGRAYPGPVETEFEIDTSRGSEAARVEPRWRVFQGPGDFAEVEEALTPEEARAEAGRCYSCGGPFGKYRTCWFCLPCEVECPQDALWVEIPYLLR